MRTEIHSCGDINPFVPELVEIGLDALNPLEVKAGMDPVRIKRTYGRDLALRGGFDVRNWTDPDKIEAEIRTLLPVMMASGGYVFASDHSIAEDVSVEDYRRIVRLVKDVGTYA